ncbi:protein-tyrosine phosphatase family protein [Xinfangfangia sp. CPCC 101601]|uniref:Protein-tyrosine phosphatase family protein n=1 Tax=Pseudogemmobacter lacusdianii TaxID=3069608 RepID=A0ABU0VYN5_9RHOB|nr:protein-tyrosine phosphatase family protein [Xinfangfangia sp. CPCC 101601]MDQ2066824.1 protein-tyrosine phosphatase family protein [Xinfangfangia sp. CPCC 101601]
MAFTIAKLKVGAGMLAISAMPGRGGVYDADLREILRFGPALVLSMTTLGELQAKGAERLESDLSDHGILWRHCPVQDYSVPAGGPKGGAWPKISAEIHEILAEGERVLVHCMGGCGRSGMAVLRLMVEAGEPADEALRRLRQARPCAVETDAQFNWAALGRGW